jgi:predicted deacetylase
MGGAAGQQRLVVSIHDVAPPFLEDVRYLLAALDGITVRPRVLKVIPNWEQRDDIRGDEAFARLLAAEAAAGSEIVLHGYTHRATGPSRGPWPRRLRARLFAGTAAEFLSLDDTAMRERLAAGQEALKSLGIEARGFCAPAWLAPPHLPLLLRERGFSYYVQMLSLCELATGRRHWTPWLGYMGAGEAQERLVGLGGGAWLMVAPTLPVIKVFFHPQGARTSPACARVLSILARLAQARQPVTFESLLNGQSR